MTYQYKGVSRCSCDPGVCNALSLPVDEFCGFGEDTIDGWTVVPPALRDPDNEKNECCSSDAPCQYPVEEPLKGMDIFKPKDEQAKIDYIERKARHPSSARFYQILADLGVLHDRKQADYGRDADPFANVRGSEDWGMPSWVGAMVRATDKVRRLQTYARKGELANESVQDAFMDLAVYAVIAMVLWEQDQVAS